MSSPDSKNVCQTSLLSSTQDVIQSWESVLAKFDDWIEKDERRYAPCHSESDLEAAKRELYRVQWTVRERISKALNRNRNEDADRVKEIEFWSRRVDELVTQFNQKVGEDKVRRKIAQKAFKDAAKEKDKFLNIAREKTLIWYQSLKRIITKMVATDTSVTARDNQILERCKEMYIRLVNIYNTLYNTKLYREYGYSFMIISHRLFSYNLEPNDVKFNLKGVIQDLKEMDEQLTPLTIGKFGTQTA